MLRFGDERGWLNSDIYSVEDQSSVMLECFGTRNLQWNSSTGLEISLNRSDDIYWSYDHTRDALALVIQNFTISYAAVYTCMSDLFMFDSGHLSLSLLITSCELFDVTCSPYSTYLSLSLSLSSTPPPLTANPAVFIQSNIQYVLAGNSTTIEATVHASPADSALVQWYHNATLINTLNDTRYSTSQDGSAHRLEIENVSDNELGEYEVVVSVGGVNASDEITLEFFGEYTFCLNF